VPHLPRNDLRRALFTIIRLPMDQTTASAQPDTMSLSVEPRFPALAQPPLRGPPFAAVLIGAKEKSERACVSPHRPIAIEQNRNNRPNPRLEQHLASTDQVTNGLLLRGDRVKAGSGDGLRLRFALR